MKFRIIITACLLGITLSSCGGTGKDNSPTHAFSVSENNYVYFAESNLQFNPAQNKWKFADNAYDCMDSANDNIGESYDGYVDLFGWCTPNYPCLTSTTNEDYGDGANDATGTNNDYGIYLKNVIGDGYRMFTHDEIHYILMYRKNADKLFGYGQIDDRKGLFIMPDDFVLPNGLSFVSAPDDGFENNYNWYWSNGVGLNYQHNKYSKDDWLLLKSAGAVFLPCAGLRYENETSHINISGHYWTSSHYGREFANCLCLFKNDLFLEGNFDRSYGLAIRLVKEAK